MPALKPRLAPNIEVVPDLTSILAANFYQIRLAVGGTQEAFAEKLGMEQSTISNLERGKSFSQIGRLGQAIYKAGGDPLDLLRPRGGPAADPQMVEIRALLDEADTETKRLVLDLLRHMAALRRQSH